MSPHAGEDPLSLVFALTFAVLGGLIALYITWRVTSELLEKRRLGATEPKPQQFTDRPDLQERVDALYMARRQAREAIERRVEDAAARHALIDAFDARMKQGVAQAAQVQAGDEEAMRPLDTTREVLERLAASLESGEGEVSLEQVSDTLALDDAPGDDTP